ncbi:class I SAM-dependent methyltransferase [Paenibacillus sp. GXUN7292]|uniref:class I SAM-dependent methyltransferase n=1 Tax=Paenibacillus sp. GXUN7292 TaxID=3422499 RepID=UPI003D7D23F6
MIVTTAVKPTEAHIAKAQQLAREVGGQFVPREKHSIQKLKEQSAEGAVIVVTEKEVRLFDAHRAQPFFFHPSMALVRVKRLLKGEQDPLLVLSKCEQGDHIIDCTAGLCGDSLVFSFGAGREGKVTALESEPVLCALVRDGLASYRSGEADIDEAMRRIELQCTEHLQFLKKLPDKSADIIYFDPMFRQPVHESSSMKPLRTIANASPLTIEAIREATRVARKTVIMKENNFSDQFEQLGFKKISHAKIGYGVIHIDGA